MEIPIDFTVNNLQQRGRLLDTKGIPLNQQDHFLQCVLDLVTSLTMVCCPLQSIQAKLIKKTQQYLSKSLDGMILAQILKNINPCLLNFYNNCVFSHTMRECLTLNLVRIQVNLPFLWDVLECMASHKGSWKPFSNVVECCHMPSFQFSFYLW